MHRATTRLQVQQIAALVALAARRAQLILVEFSYTAASKMSWMGWIIMPKVSFGTLPTEDQGSPELFQQFYVEEIPRLQALGGLQLCPTTWEAMADSPFQCSEG